MKTLVTILALSLATIFSAHAQTTKTAEKIPAQTKVQPQQDLSQQVQTQTERMTKDLDLSPEQVDRVMSENKTLFSNIQSLKMEKVNPADRDKMISRSIDNYDMNLKNILDESQFGTYQNMKAEYMKTTGLPNVTEKQKK